MSSPSGSTVARPLRRGSVRFIAGPIIAFGLIASILLVCADDIHYVRLGLVSALWAAVIAALMMAKFRRELIFEGARTRDLRAVYQLQLDREMASRREFELGVESRVRRDLRIDIDQLAGLHRELATVRENLEILLDGDLAEQRTALPAEMAPVQELPSANGFRLPPQPMFIGSAGPVFATPFDEPVTAETSAVPLEHLHNGYLPKPRSESWSTEFGWSEPEQPRWQPWETVPHGRWKPVGDDAYGSRDDDGSHSTGLSVAQIMANLRAEHPG